MIGTKEKSNKLKSILKGAAIVFGLYQLSNLTTFLGGDFRRKGLTEEQVELMDKHNKAHNQFEKAHLFAGTLLGALGVDEKKSIDRSGEIAIFDEQIKSLPSRLKHKHK